MDKFNISQQQIAEVSAKLQNLLPWQLAYFANRIAEAEAIALSSPAKCRSCGAPILWGKTEAGKNCPYDEATGESHFKTCPDANRWSRKQATTKGYMHPTEGWQVTTEDCQYSGTGLQP